MDINTKLEILNRIYRIYDDFSRDLKVACEKYCAQCCTTHVTLTTLEGYMIVEHLLSGEMLLLLGKVETGLSDTRFQPKMTINRLAELCMEGKDFQDEVSDFTGGGCPFLQKNECLIYAVRPFMCRCMVSKQDCRNTGYADVDPFVISVNNLFLQTIEHVDSAGCSGNLSDVLLFWESEDNRRNYREKNLNCSDAELIPNQPMKVLMIPPEHRERIAPILNQLRSIQVPET
ncbi:MAG: hypothetical protein JRI75_09885 [Deltaproteobacteria bacterium]|nr:hypothetical protein [Deltaproteobacteria bacterium]